MSRASTDQSRETPVTPDRCAKTNASPDEPWGLESLFAQFLGMAQGYLENKQKERVRRR